MILSISFFHFFLIFIHVRCLFFLIMPLFLFNSIEAALPAIKLGVDQLFTKDYELLLQGKQIGLITNHTAVNSHMQWTVEILKKHANSLGYQLTALFAPEHGLMGEHYAGENIKENQDLNGIPIYSLYGQTHRPTKAMLQNVNLLIYDIQDIGSRSYTYVSTLFYVMEEAAKLNIPLLVLDRPNPINGLTVDGPVLEDRWRSILGYVNVSYCHGMTIGELALYFNEEYHIGCPLIVVPMKGWRRSMSFDETGLKWIPTSPHIPEASTAFYYPTTGILGELQMVSIGIGYTLPFKLVGAPWINASLFAERLNAQHFPGVYFYPFYYRPFFGKFSQEHCQGVLILITNPTIYLPVATQYLLIGMLKSLYPKEFEKALQASQDREEIFNKVNGTAEVYRILKEERYPIWKLRELHRKEREEFMRKREKYLIPSYK